MRLKFFDGKSPSPMQFLMPQQPLHADADVAVIVGLHQKLGGPWKLVYLFRRLVVRASPHQILFARTAAKHEGQTSEFVFELYN